MKILENVIKKLGSNITTMSDFVKMIDQALGEYGNMPVSGPTLGMDYGSVIDGFNTTSFKAKFDGGSYKPEETEVIELLAGESMFEIDEPGEIATDLKQLKKMAQDALSKYDDLPVVGPTHGADYASVITGIEKVNDVLLEVVQSDESQFSSFVDE